jgi:imidazolonepropionase
MMRLGSTTVEVKTGFGLTERDELKLTEVAHELTEEHFLDIVPTYYGASAVPPEFQGNESGYIDILCSRQLPYLAKRGIVSWCDVNCDAGGFSLDQARTILQTAQSLGMKVKLHAGRFASMGAVDLAAEFCAVSADHLNGATALDIATLVSSKCVATLMPCVSFAAGEAIPPVRAMIQAGLPLALATHADPCTALCFSMPMAMTIACRQWGMTAEEAITATTLNAAAALGCSETIGSIEEGKQADIVLWNIPHYRSLLYQFGNQTAWKVIKRGTYLDY